MQVYSQTTQRIRIDVEPKYLPEHSSPADERFVFSYTVTIHNQGNRAVQLLRRRWRIMDGRGRTELVKGPGVVGQQPLIRPGESFQYSSFCPLPTPTGNMRGRFVMVDDQQQEFEVVIPLFFLRDISLLH